MSKQTKITNFFNVCQNQINSSDGQQSSETKTGSDCNESVKCDNKRKFGSIDKPVVSNGNYKKKNNNKTLNPRPRSGQKKICPFYKKIPNTAFAVDAFSYGSIGDISVYFLTHFHSDHYNGLNNSFKHEIYCSPITASLVRHHFKKALFTLKVIDVNQTQEVMGTRVTFFDANHCPGAVVILFELRNGLRHLHTGDFRADHSFFTNKQLICRPIDTIFLDTTYCDPKYKFLPQKEILKTIVSISSDYYKKNSKLLIVCGSYSIGKENVFISIAKALDLKVWTNAIKSQIYKCYKNPEIDSLLVSDRRQSSLHVLSMNSINISFLEEYIKEFNGLFDEVLAFRPTGWEHSKTGVKVRNYKNIAIYGIEYSEHSSFTELQSFVSFFKPNKVIPTVNNNNEFNINKMNLLFNNWIKCEDEDSSEVTVIPRKPKINGSIISWIHKNKISDKITKSESILNNN